MSEQAELLKLQNISVNFREKKRQVQAVKDVNITIQKGTIFGLIGYSGAGKSTLARTINLLQQPTKGKVLLNGTDISSLNGAKLREWRRKIGMIFQHFNLMATRTVEDNVILPLTHSKLSKQEKKAKAEELLKLVGLNDLKNAYPSQLSGGQKQRVAIARALANDPEILISYESTSALDPKTTHNILHLLEKLNKKLDLTIVLITHEMEVVKQITNQVAVMDHGEIIEQGSTTELFINPQQALTRELLVDGDQDDDQLDNLVKKYHSETVGLVNFTYQEENIDIHTLLNQVSQHFPTVKPVYTNSQFVEDQLWGNVVLTVNTESLDGLIAWLSDQEEVVAVNKMKEVQNHAMAAKLIS